MLLQWVTLVIAATLAASAAVGWRVQRKPLDRWFFATMLPFACLAALEVIQARHVLSESNYVVATRVSYQLVVLGVISFLMLRIGGVRWQHRLVVVLQALLGLMLAVMPPASLPQPLAHAWQWVNGTAGVLLLAFFVYGLVRYGATRGWTILLAAIAAAGVLASDMYAAGTGPIAVSWPQFFYMLILLVLWLLQTNRVKSQGPGATRSAMRAAAAERERLMRDLHDGIGSRLTTIIASLGASENNPQLTAYQLQECMLALKLMIDGSDADASLLSLLASLRYRMHPMLSAAGIQLHWSLRNEEAVDTLCGESAVQVLHIAQEAISNAVRHARTSSIELMCMVTETSSELILRVQDQGIGLPTKPVSGPGSGIGGMHARASRLGGTLEVGPRIYGSGTSVTLRVPLDTLANASAGESPPGNNPGTGRPATPKELT